MPDMIPPMTPLDLRHIRKKLGLTQTAFAARLGVSRRLICAYETGGTEIPIMAELACKHLQTGLDFSGRTPHEE